MDKKAKEIKLNRAFIATLFDPNEMALDALESPEAHQYLLDEFRKFAYNILDSRMGLLRDNLIFITNRIKEALDIVDINLHIRGELPRVGKQGS